MGDYIRDYYRGYKGDTKTLDYGSHMHGYFEGGSLRIPQIGQLLIIGHPKPETQFMAVRDA